MSQPSLQKQNAQALLRPIAPQDNAIIAHIIRSVLAEFGCFGEGFASHDPELDDMFQSYASDGNAYFVLECDGVVIGGGGVSQLAGTKENICELQKFYVLPDYRGRGYGKMLLERCLSYARSHGYGRCYIETVEQMGAAETLYRSVGFEPISMPLGNTGHHSCDRWYVRVL